MIRKFAELGQYYRDREGVGVSALDQLDLYSHDPAAKFKTRTVLLLVFDNEGFSRFQVEEYDDSKRRTYLYRPGPTNGWDATPTSGLRVIREHSPPNLKTALAGELRKKLLRLGRSIADSLRSIESPEPEAATLQRTCDFLLSVSESAVKVEKITDDILTLLPPEPKSGALHSHAAILSVAWATPGKSIKYVGDYTVFQRALIQHGLHSASRKKTISGEIKGLGQCSICGAKDTQVFGHLQIPNFKLYTLDKRGSVSGGFDTLNAWRNFPACRECCDRVGFAGERVKKHLSFNYYGLRYLFLPSPLQRQRTAAYEFLDRLTDARVAHATQQRLTDAEDELLYAISEEQDLLQVDLLFYQPDPKFFRPSLYVPGLLPTRFRALFSAKEHVECHPWLRNGSNAPLPAGRFTFGSLRSVFPASRGGSSFDEDFLAATRAALEMRPYSLQRMLHVGMRWVRQDYLTGRHWQLPLFELFKCILFFEFLTGSICERSAEPMNVDYGTSDQAERVRNVFRESSGKLGFDPVAQAAFLVGACCSRIEMIQQRVRLSAPFAGKLKGFRLNQQDMQRLFVAAKDKAKAYGPEEERKVDGLLTCAATALAAAPDRWALSSDEISFFFALGHALRPRLAKETNDELPAKTSSDKPRQRSETPTTPKEVL